MCSRRMGAPRLVTRRCGRRPSGVTRRASYAPAISAASFSRSSVRAASARLASRDWRTSRPWPSSQPFTPATPSLSVHQWATPLPDRASSRSAEGMPSVPPPALPPLAWLVGRLDRRVSRRTAQGFAATLADIHDGGMGDTAERLAYALANRTGLTGDTVGYLETRSLGFHWLESLLPGSHLFPPVPTHLSQGVSLLAACCQGPHPPQLPPPPG